MFLSNDNKIHTIQEYIVYSMLWIIWLSFQSIQWTKVLIKSKRSLNILKALSESKFCANFNTLLLLMTYLSV